MTSPPACPSVAFAKVCLLAVVCVTSASIGADDAPAWRITDTPAWVEPVAPFSSRFADAPAPGSEIDVRLYERQMNLVDRERPQDWRAMEYEFLSREGVSSESRFTIGFDPSYQSVRLHELSIERAGQLSDRLATARIDLLHREHDLDESTFDGRRSLSIVLGDVRIGDVLRAAWSIEGANPVFGGLYESDFYTTVSHGRREHQRLRVLNDARRPLTLRVVGEGPAIARSVKNGVETFALEQSGLVPLYSDDESDPNGPVGRVVFGDVADWAGVVAFEAPLYRPETGRPAELVAIAERIRSGHPDVAGRVGAALDWVQEEIRYFNVQLGAYSHLPATAAETLRRRFADCKGKALLLITLLDELGIEAAAALVNTDGALRDPAYAHRLHAFDHVVVMLEHAGVRHWIDPTMIDQRGALGDFSEPDFDAALVLIEGETELRPMGGPRAGWFVEVRNELDLPTDRGAPVAFTVTTIRRGASAEALRSDLRRKGNASIGSDYLEYYEGRYPQIRQLEPMAIDDSADGTLTTLERYSIDGFWDPVDQELVWLSADTVDDTWLKLPDADPDAASTELPIAVRYPVDVQETWRIDLPEPMRIGELGGEIVTPWYRFDETSSYDETDDVLTVNQRFRRLVDEVAATDREAHEGRADEVDDLIWLSLEDRQPRPAWMQSFVDEFKAGQAAAENAGDPFAELSTVDRLNGAVGALALPVVGFVAFRRRRDRAASRSTQTIPPPAPVTDGRSPATVAR